MTKSLRQDHERGSIQRYTPLRVRAEIVEGDRLEGRADRGRDRPAPSRVELVRRFGDGDLIACSTLQPDMRWFETSFGAIAYRSVFGLDVTLGGPLAAPTDRAAVIERFLATRRRALLCYVRADVMRLLDGSGLHGAGMGVDRHVDLPALLAAPDKAVRGAIKRAARAGVTVEPMDFAALDEATRARLAEINARYLARAECTVEMSFLNRPMSVEPDGLRRLFLVRERGRLFGFVVLNPIFDRGAVTSWLLDILRFEPTKVWGLWLSTVHALAARVHREDAGLSVGFAPLHRIQRPPCNASRALGAQMDLMVRLLSSAQYVRRLRELKELVPGREEPRFFASPSRSALTSLFALMEVSGIGWRYLFGRDLVRVLARGVRGG